MTDKQIIIDDVDVSKCEFYCEEYCTLSNDRNERLPFAEKCTGYSDCCYKQLKHKEQECEKLKQILTEIKFWARELLKRTGQVVPFEIEQILQKISECKAEWRSQEKHT